MHGLGNDFVVIDNMHKMQKLNKQLIQAIANRHTGIGCDQLISLTPSQKADVKMAIYNADGSVAEACGNATRCVAKYINEQTKQSNITIEFNDFISKCKVNGKNYSCNMGCPKMSWKDIPLANPMDCLELDFHRYDLPAPVAVNIGNPHVVFFIKDFSKFNLEKLGPLIENDPLFPKQINVSFAKILDKDQISLQVWERGAGITQACGTAACSTAFAAIKRGHTNGNKVKILFNHGNLLINLLKDGSLEMSGGAETIFTGTYYYD